MKKYLSLGLVIASSLLLSACSLPKKGDNQSSTTTPSQSQESSSFSIRDLIAQNIPQKCLYSGSDEEGSFESEILISGKKFKQIIKYKSAQGEEDINSISDGEYVYTWGKHATSGDFAIKMKADFDQKTSPETPSDDSSDGEISSVDLDSDFQGKCSPTIVSDADFKIPSDVKFEDYSQFLDQLKSSVPIPSVTESE